ncbi:ABC transporter ATP-binding protein [Candidatus Atribacteria bacterium HGW-Atribacteria-1]|nr:MAG: ABC transporter ATP-binding protein [Candidatus Atribacteria bacterium HGW-Atribacteria-1]
MKNNSSDTTTDPLLTVKELRGYYRGTFGVVHGVDGVTFSINKGEVLGLAGESGCGKSTIAVLATGTPGPLLYFEGGEIKIEGIDIYHNISPERLRTEIKCQRLSYVPQAASNSLNPVKRIRDFIADVVKERTGEKLSKEEVRRIAGERFRELGLDERVLDLYPHELSGGMKQRVIIAISTLWNPKLLIVDEPTSALDVTSQRRMTETLVNLKRKGIVESILYISHDIATLRQLCDRCLIMYCGKIVEMGKMDDIISNPLHPYTQKLISSIVSYEPKRRKKGGQLESIPGRPPDLRNPPPGCRFHPRCEKCKDICKTEFPLMAEVKGRNVWCWLCRDGRDGLE